VGAKAFGFRVAGGVPQTISRAKDEKLQALGVELLKIAGGGSDLIRTATEVARQRGAYFVHPHLGPLWTDGYQATVREILQALPGCRSLVFPVGGGGLLMGLTEYLGQHPAPVRLVGCEAFNFPTYAPFHHQRSRTIAEGLVLDDPHPAVQQRIAERGMTLHLVTEADIAGAMRLLYDQQGLIVEPSSAVTIAVVKEHERELQEPVCLILTGENITREDFFRLIAVETAETGRALTVWQRRAGSELQVRHWH